MASHDSGEIRFTCSALGIFSFWGRVCGVVNLPIVTKCVSKISQYATPLLSPYSPVIIIMFCYAGSKAIREKNETHRNSTATFSTQIDELTNGNLHNWSAKFIQLWKLNRSIVSTIIWIQVDTIFLLSMHFAPLSRF